MTTPTILIELAERVEAATGPDRELDIEIGFQLASRERLWALSGMNAQRPLFSDDDLWRQVRRCPTEYGLGHCYTSSLDSAMTLVPEGWRLYMLSSSDQAKIWSANLWVMASGEEVDSVPAGRAATPALALTAACLRALALSEEKGNG